MNKKALLSLLAVSAVAMSTPALAQSHNNNDRHGGGRGGGSSNTSSTDRQIDARQSDLARQVDRLVQRRVITRGQKQVFDRQFSTIDRLQRDYRRDGYNRREINELNAQLDRVASQIRYESRDNDRPNRPRH